MSSLVVPSIIKRSLIFAQMEKVWRTKGHNVRNMCWITIYEDATYFST